MSQRPKKQPPLANATQPLDSKISSESVTTPLSNTRIIAQYQQSQSWSGPLPPPKILQDYDAAVSGAAQTIVEMAKKQQDHRIAVQKRLVDNQTIGLAFGGIVALSSVAGAIYLAKDAPGVSACLLSLPVLGFIKILVSGDASKSQNSSPTTANKKPKNRK